MFCFIFWQLNIVSKVYLLPEIETNVIAIVFDIFFISQAYQLDFCNHLVSDDLLEVWRKYGKRKIMGVNFYHWLFQL